MENKNRFYVYIQKQKDTGEVFYLGKGTKHRCNSLEHRSKKWHIAAANGFDVEILFKDLTHVEALQKEAELLQNPSKKWKLINIAKTNSVSISFEEVNEWVYYCPTSKTGLRRKKVCEKGRPTELHSETGSLVQDSNKNPTSWSVAINGKYYKAHRLVYILHNKNIDPSLVIDHIDGDPLNNKIENLRQVSYSENAKNRIGNYSDMTSILSETVKDRNGFRSKVKVRWTIDGKRLRKEFCITKTRSKEEALTLAKAFRDDLIKQGLILTRGI